MGMFAIIGQPGANADKLPAAVAKEFPDSHMKLQSSVWLVAATGTAQDISKKLGIPDNVNGLGIVLQLNGDYFGRANTNIWAWIKSQWETINRG